MLTLAFIAVLFNDWLAAFYALFVAIFFSLDDILKLLRENKWQTPYNPDAKDEHD